MGQARQWVRAALLTAAIALIVLGLLDGGFVDVMRKAAMVCYECIGIG